MSPWTDEPVLVLEGVSKTLGNTRVLKGASLSVAVGEFVVVRGKSGVGKSTLARIAALMLKPDSGRVLFRGVDVTGLGDSGLSQVRLKYIGYVDQFFSLIDSYTVYENVELPLRIMGLPEKERRRRVADALRLLEIEELAGSLPGELSGGQRQRVAIARAIAKRPVLLVADEPTSNLDNYSEALVVSLFRRLAAEGRVAVLMTTTDLVTDFPADRDMVLLDGRIVERAAIR
ncbi:ABC transporter ATP-binding protein [Infirmifilum lucidum]|uniref:ABC transporter ATP-binding protein n=1 Tax=Infirmifilum lucidum TaxID=2776706 RepID=A0A7L9FKG0_9CREN|nr:ABC transporter ATP-binding protein [Infirmifilum lucidum]QOJ79295.1 ABC transporter ATP-binding protein [Infirmifilum lucidum]